MKQEKYTKVQRLAIYKLALKELSKDIQCMPDGREMLGGFCAYMKHATDTYCSTHPTASYHRFVDDKNGDYDYLFPEIFEYRPYRGSYVEGVYNSARVFWFSQLRGDGGIKRLQILENIVADMQDKERKIVTFQIVLTYK